MDPTPESIGDLTVGGAPLPCQRLGEHRPTQTPPPTPSLVKTPHHDDYQKTADWILSQTQHRPKVAIICGSGLGMLADALKLQDSFHYSDIPGFPQSTELKGKTCVCMQGRFHMYEGHSLCKVTFPVRVFKLLGVETLIVTNAAGALADGFGPRFPPMSGVYDKDLRRLAKDICKSLGYSQFVQEGVYCMVGGPNFESIAEARFLHKLGADAVGMSTAPEVLVASHCGMKVFGLSLITNKVVKDYDDTEKVNHEGVLGVSKMRSETLQTLVTELVSRLDINNNTA
ncbi:hypothetical protein JZ751_017992 [Albula glossodonta]|uniref:Purine nucleoside phosphorylase n=1 Tax=Albula glossodonta TaxID=121402 RepID=A0A8T2PPV7_9TELE|nr:hypothetical protein JZ751_017992 [Albula glossodonta]